VFVRNVDYDNMQLKDGIRIFVAEAYDPAVAPPAFVDPVLQGAALNAKPPKPPRWDAVQQPCFKPCCITEHGMPCLAAGAIESPNKPSIKPSSCRHFPLNILS